MEQINDTLPSASSPEARPPATSKRKLPQIEPPGSIKGYFSSSGAKPASTERSASRDDGGDRLPRWDSDDFEHVLSWLENKDNFASVYGKGGRTQVGAKYVSATKAWDIFANWFNQRTKSSLTGKALLARCKRYKANYTKALRFGTRTGSGLTDKDVQDDISSIELKREKICYAFNRMHALFGSSPSVEPLTQVSTSAAGVTFRGKASKTTMAQRVDTRAAIPCTIGEPDVLEDDWGDDYYPDPEMPENQEEQTQEEQTQEDVEEDELEDDLEEVEENDYFTPTQTSVTFKPTDFMNHRQTAPSVSTGSFPSALRRANSSQTGSTTRSSKSQNARLNPPPPVQDITVKKAIPFSEAFMSTMEMKIKADHTLETMKLEFQREERKEKDKAEAKKERTALMRSAVEKGLSLADIKELLQLADGDE
ncbi:MAG: hypothetical protein J3R72DRAFT_433495 [Linnemannia gamsii]|nr:MAG: hypothetical protein J3R72DRAFT_433495 [Linnemannia gamsii]